MSITKNAMQRWLMKGQEKKEESKAKEQIEMAIHHLENVK